MTLGQWLDAVLGETRESLAPDTRDALAADALAADALATDRPAKAAAPRAAAPAQSRTPAQAQGRPPVDTLEQRLDELERRLSRGEPRTGTLADTATDLTDRFPPAHERAAGERASGSPRSDAIESRLGRLVSAIGSNMPVSREDAPEALRTIAGRLDRLGGTAARDDHERRAARDTVRQLEERLQAIAQQMESGRPDAVKPAPAEHERVSHEPVSHDPRPPLVTRTRALETAEPAPVPDVSPAPIDGLKEAIAEIASRQQTLEGEFDRAVGSYADRIDHRIDSVAERIEQSIEEASPNAMLRDLHAEIREANSRGESAQTRDVADLRLMVTDIAHRIETVPARVAEDLAGRLEDTLLRLDTATRSELDAIRGELREIAQDLDQSSRSEFEALRAEVARLADRIEATQAPVMPDIDARIEDIAVRLDTAARSEFGAIRADVREIVEQLDSTGRSEFKTLRTEIKDLGDRLSQERADAAPAGHDETAHADLEAIRSEIRGLSVQIDGVRRDEYEALRNDMKLLGERITEAPSARFGELERHLIQLTEKLASAAQDGDPEALAQLEKQISRLAENVDASSRNMAGIGELDKTIGDLFSRIEENRTEAMEAARAAAMDAVDRAAASLSGGAGGTEIFDGLREELAAQRANADAADRRNQDTLQAVHETLKKIAGRLEDLEDDETAGTSRLPRAPAVVAPTDAESTDVEPAGIEQTGIEQTGAVAEAAEPQAGTIEDTGKADTDPDRGDLDPDDIVGRIDAVAKSFRVDSETARVSEDDIPLAPGTRMPKASFTDTDDNEPEGNRSDFVAAARRAARAATAEQTGGMAPLAGDKAPRLQGLRSGLAKYRRPLAITAAIVIIIFGAVKIASYIQSNPGFFSMIGSSASKMATGKGQSSATQPAGQTKTAAAKPDRATPANSKPARQINKAKADSGEPTGSVPDPATVQAKTASAGTTAPATAKDRLLTPAPQSNPTQPAGEESAVPENALPEKLRVAIDSGDATAQFEVAARYMDGRGLPQDYGKAAEWYRKGAAQGLAPAQYRLGSLYEKGQGVGRDLAMARMWYQRAAEQGNRKAMHNLAVLYADGVDGSPDYEKAAMWFRQAAEYGLGDSQFNLAVLFARGLGVKSDMGESFRWFAIAADQGDGEALQKRDEVARDLDEETLRKARAALDAWKPKQPDVSANVVPEPQGGWGDARPMNQVFIDSDLVTAAQALLTELGYSPGPADGQIGPRTRDAVRAFQRSVGMPDDGDISPDLVDRLDSAAG